MRQQDEPVKLASERGRELAGGRGEVGHIQAWFPPSLGLSRPGEQRRNFLQDVQAFCSLLLWASMARGRDLSLDERACLTPYRACSLWASRARENGPVVGREREPPLGEVKSPESCAGEALSLSLSLWLSLPASPSAHSGMALTQSCRCDGEANTGPSEGLCCACRVHYVVCSCTHLLVGELLP